MPKYIRRHFIALLAGLTIFACSDLAPSTPVAASGNTHIVAAALWGEPVFDRDMNDFVSAMKRASSKGATARKASMRQLGIDGTIDKLNAHYRTLGATNASDTIVTFLTTHGHKGIVALGAGTQAVAATASDLNALFAPVDDHPHIIIIQACYSGSLIPELKRANRIIITAADADHPSFGCAPDAKNTWFTKALKSEIQAGRSWETVFEKTYANVTAFERQVGVPKSQSSNPQIYVGGAMKAIYGAPL